MFFEDPTQQTGWSGLFCCIAARIDKYIRILVKDKNFLKKDLKFLILWYIMILETFPMGVFL